MKLDLLTREDLENFKHELLEELRKFFPHPRPTETGQKEWLKSYEVRKVLGISPGTLQNLRVSGTLPYSQVGGLMYYRYADIQKLLEGGINGGH